MWRQDDPNGECAESNESALRGDPKLYTLYSICIDLLLIVTLIHARI